MTFHNDIAKLLVFESAYNASQKSHKSTKYESMGSLWLLTLSRQQ